MLDIRFVRENADLVQAAANHKGYQVDVRATLGLDDKRRDLQTRVDTLRTQKNQNAAELKGGRPTKEQIETGKKIKAELTQLEGELKSVQEDFDKQFKLIPNLPETDVPLGKSEDDNKIAKTVGDTPKFDFAPKNHADLAEARGWLDKERAAKVAGARFAYLKGDLVKLQLAIVQLVVDQLTDEAVLKNIAEKAGLSVSSRPFIPVLPPLMIKTEPYDMMDRLEPSDDRYKIDGEELWLQGSAEHVLGSMHAGEIFEEADLPIRYLGYATSFRKEAGTYGKDMEGIIRMHQFDKLEMESFTCQETSRDEHLFFIAIQEHLLGLLDLPYQVLLKCTADIGKPNARGVDMEVWLPGQGKYRETHTADYMTDYQSRRLNTRVRRKTGELELVHTNDATAFALGRIMVAILENYQTKDGQIRIPAALKPYVGGRDQL
ncbi:MAG TPA: serine--tRNA ligase [Candidatus Saccharimonadales bacterium]|nr:serine--tRNA ligase [Candidatus Saccharimonadales bacterium]